MQDMAKMREVTKTIVESGDSSKNLVPTDVASLPITYDSEYFNSYSHYGIHQEMLSVCIIIFCLFLLIVFDYVISKFVGFSEDHKL